MNEYLLLKFLHLVGFAYWLGCDLGVFYTSYVVTDERQPDAVRLVSAKILLALDLVPRMSMTIMPALGTHLAWKMGVLPLDAATVAAVWVVCVAWLGWVIALHRAADGTGKSRLAAFDFAFRVAVAAGLVAAGTAAWLGAGRIPDWLALKYAIFGAMVAMGLLIRIRLRPFGPAFAALAAGKVTDADNRVIRASLAGTRPYVLAIWAGLALSAALGIHLL